MIPQSQSAEIFRHGSARNVVCRDCENKIVCPCRAVKITLTGEDKAHDHNLRPITDWSVFTSVRHTNGQQTIMEDKWEGEQLPPVAPA